ncbi:MAG: hypothetical protein ABL917_01255 [Parcubacteria group bacterium]
MGGAERAGIVPTPMSAHDVLERKKMDQIRFWAVTASFTVIITSVVLAVLMLRRNMRSTKLASTPPPVTTHPTKESWGKRLGRWIANKANSVSRTTSRFVLILMAFVLITFGIRKALSFSLGADGLLIADMLIAFVIIMTGLLLGIAWNTGYLRSLFFQIETSNLAFVDSGQSNVFTYANVTGKILRWGVKIDDVLVQGKIIRTEVRDGDELINDWVLVDEEYEGQSEKEKTFIQKTWGYYWRGFDIFNRRVHVIPLTKKKANANLRPGMPPEEWITGSDNVAEVDQLRSEFPRPVAVPDMKFSDGIEANLLLQGNYEVVVPRRPVYNLKGDFTSIIESYTRTAMKDVAMTMTAEDFRKASQVEGSAMSNSIVALINRKLIETCGVRLRGASVPVYNLSSDAEEKAAKAEELARLEGLAKIAEAKAQAEVAKIAAERAAANKLIDATAEAEADNLRNAASITDVTLATTAMIKDGVHPDIAAQVAGATGRATRYTHPDSKVTTQVEGGGAVVTIPPIERKVVLADK